MSFIVSSYIFNQVSTHYIFIYVIRNVNPCLCVRSSLFYSALRDRIIVVRGQIIIDLWFYRLALTDPVE